MHVIISKHALHRVVERVNRSEAEIQSLALSAYTYGWKLNELSTVLYDWITAKMSGHQNNVDGAFLYRGYFWLFDGAKLVTVLMPRGYLVEEYEVKNDRGPK